MRADAGPAPRPRPKPRAKITIHTQPPPRSEAAAGGGYKFKPVPKKDYGLKVAPTKKTGSKALAQVADATARVHDSTPVGATQTLIAARASDLSRLKFGKQNEHKGGLFNGIGGYTTNYDKKTGQDLNSLGGSGARIRKQAAALAPAVKVLDQTMRPIRGIATTADQLVKGKSVTSSLGSGGKAAYHNKGVTFSRVLKDVGAPKSLQGVGGFVLDVALDPTTYLTMGAGSATAKLAQRAAMAATKDALKAGATKKVADKAGRSAARVVLNDPKLRNKGIKVGVRAKVPFTDKGIDVRTSGRGSAAVSRKLGVSKGATWLRNTGPVQKLGKAFVHDFKPSELTPAQHKAARAAATELRAKNAADERLINRRTAGLDNAAPGVDEHRAIQDAIEGAPKDVKAHLSDLEALRAANATLKKAQRAAALGPSRKAVGKAKRAATAAERAVQAHTRGAGVAQGRAEVLSRNVSGLSAERAAEKGGKDVRGRGTPADVLAHIDAVLSGSSYAGGGHGVLQSGGELAAAEAHLSDTRKKLADALVAHERTKANGAHSGLATPDIAAAQKEADSVAARIAANRVGHADLPPELSRAATNVTRDFEKDAKRKIAAGLMDENGRFQPQGPHDAQGFIPHKRRIDVENPKIALKNSKGGASTVSKDKSRSIRMPLNVADSVTPSTFSRDLPLIYKADRQRSARQANLSEYWGKFTKAVSRPLTGKSQIDWNTEGVYKPTPHGLEEIRLPGSDAHAPDQARIAAILADKSSEPHVIIPHSVVDDARKRLRGTGSEDDIIGSFARFQGKLKLAYTQPNPSYHARNLMGDSLNAFAGDASAHSYGQAVRIIGSLRGSRNKGQRAAEAFTGGGKAPKDGGTVNVKGKKYTYAQALDIAERHGAIGQGFAGGELRVTTGTESKFARATQVREDIPRMATFLSEWKRTGDPARATEWANKHHFDYNDLTPVEQKLRLAIPFYTFFARNTRMQAAKVFTRPGKQATIAKVLNSAAQAGGYDTYTAYLDGMKDYKQRGLPIPVKLHGKVYDINIAPPTTDLNQLTANWQDQVQNVANRVTFFKTIFELAPNEGYSVYFQDKIQPDTNEFTEAPAWMAEVANQFPKPVRDKMGLHQAPNKEGKQVWVWTRKTDYALRSVPLGNTVVGSSLSTTGTRGQGPGQQALGFLTGVKSTPHTSDRNTLGVLQQQVHDMEVKTTLMSREGRSVGKDGYYTPAYQKLLDQKKAASTQIDGLKKKLGYAPKVAGKRRPLTPAQQVQKELKDYKKASSPDAANKAILDEIKKFKGGG